MKISVIIPVYNVEATLERAVASIVNQTYTDLEIILVDDGSTDGSGHMCDELAQTDQRLKVIHQVNGGLSAARNTGIEAATGEYIAFLDSDDEFVHDILATFVDAYNERPMELYIFNIMRIMGEDKLIKNAKHDFMTDSVAALETLLDYNGLDFYAWNKIYQRDLFAEIRYPVGKIYEDTMVSYATVTLAKSVAVTRKVGILYYENPDSIVAQNFNPGQMDNVTERVRMLDAVKLHQPELRSKAALRVFDGLLSTGYKIATVADQEVAVKFDRELKAIAAAHSLDFKESTAIPRLKKAAWQLYKMNRQAYALAYRQYLGK